MTIELSKHVFKKCWLFASIRLYLLLVTPFSNKLVERKALVDTVGIKSADMNYKFLC